MLGGGFVNNLTTLRNGGRTLRAKDIAEEGTGVELSLAMGINSEREVIEIRCLVVSWGGDEVGLDFWSTAGQGRVSEVLPHPTKTSNPSLSSALPFSNLKYIALTTAILNQQGSCGLDEYFHPH
jgi:hypothetical protein